MTIVAKECSKKFHRHKLQWPTSTVSNFNFYIKAGMNQH